MKQDMPGYGLDELDAPSLRAVYASKMIFLTAQPAVPYFRWQTEIYLTQFSTLGLKQRCVALFGYTEQEPPKWVDELREEGFRVFAYPDTREDKSYIPSIRPHIIAKFLRDHPELGETVFYHDSDILFYRLPSFHLLLNDDVDYLSDTVSYIGYEYIKECSERYAKNNPELRPDSLTETMTTLAGISVEQIRENQLGSGGAQYLLKNLNYQMFVDIEKLSVRLFKVITDFDKKGNKEDGWDGVQIWCAGMWADLWTLWNRGHKTVVHPTLSFNFATVNYTDLGKHNIYHLAGVVGSLKNTAFYKGEYTDCDLIRDKTRADFDYVLQSSSTTYYLNWAEYRRKKLGLRNRIPPVEMYLLESHDNPGAPKILKLVKSRKFNEHPYFLSSCEEQLAIVKSSEGWSLIDTPELTRANGEYLSDLKTIEVSANDGEDITSVHWPSIRITRLGVD